MFKPASTSSMTLNMRECQVLTAFKVFHDYIIVPKVELDELLFHVQKPRASQPASKQLPILQTSIFIHTLSE